VIHVALWEPEIPPNTGNIARLCAATGSPLHLLGPCGFRLDDRHLRRAGLDYWPAVVLHQHASFADFLAAFPDLRILCVETGCGRPYTRARFQHGDCLLFGSESRGLPAEILTRSPEQGLDIPMPGGAVRSLNLATAVGIVLYEALRQLHDW
jgi:tRNA (cytidine/uridine-2'-O-)-methyltransferase